MDPASRLITAGAHKLFSSVFRKRLLPPPQHPPPDETTKKGDVQPEITTMVGPSGTKEPVVCRGNDLSRVSEGGGVADLENILKQKTFTRSEIDHLTALLLSRTVDNLVGGEKGRFEPNSSDEKAVHSRDEIATNLPTDDNGAEHVLPAAISTPVSRSKVLEDVVASPAELAKAYMGSRPVRSSPSGLGLQNEMPREDLSAPYTPFMNPRSPAMSLIQKPASEIGASANGFMTPRFRGRSAIYSMARTPYSRHHPTEASKADVHGAVSSSHNATETQQLDGSKRQVLKRRSSVLESDIGFVGPIRRIRQKPNLLHYKNLSLPASGAPRVKHGSGGLADVTEMPSSIDWSSNHRSSKALADKDMPSTSNGYVPSQSIETARKIFQNLDKFSSKGKSPEKKIDIVGGSLAGKMTTDFRDGLARKSTDTDSLKVLKTVEDIRKENGWGDSSVAHDHSLKILPRTEEGSVKKIVIPSVEDGAKAGSPNKALDCMNSRSIFDHQQKNRAFQMSAHEDYLELDDDVQANGLASTPMINGVEGHELAKSSAALSYNSPQKEATSSGKPLALELKPSTNSLGTNKEESVPDGSAAAQKIAGFAFPMGLSTSSTTSMSTQTTVSSQQKEMDKVAGQSEITAFSSSPAKVASFSFSSSPSVVESAAAKDTKRELPSSASDTVKAADGPDKADNKSTLFFGDVSKKGEGVPSSVASSAKGLFTFGMPSNGATLSNGSPSTISVAMGVSSPIQISSNSNDQSSVPVSVSSSPLFSISNGNALSTSSSATSTGAVINTTTTGGMATFGSSASQFSTSGTAPASFGSGFQFGSPAVPSTSAAVSTSALDSAATSRAKSNDSVFGNATSGLFGAKPSGTDSVGNNISGFNASALNSVSSETQTAAPGVFSGFQASSSSVAVTTSTQNFSSQSASSTSSPIFGFSAPASVNASASLSTVANPFTSGSGSASSGFGSTSVTAPVSSSSNTTSSIFGWQSSKPTVPGSIFGTSSQSTGFTFGQTASGASAASNSTPIVFGASSSSSVTSNSTPIVFGATSSASTANSAPFSFGASSSAASVFSVPSAVSTPALSTPFPSQPVFGISTPQPYAFGSTPHAGSNDRMSMEDSMAEDSVQVSTPAAPVFGQPISAPSSNFVFNGAAPSVGSPFQFSGQQNQIAPQNTSFQPSGSLEFNAGGAGSFSLGSGGVDKSNRRIVKVRKGIRRK